eukprot:GHVR01118935.1.p1 GENE.GHVR01118935.1~~GHVR01118935.1.p1  ORF type:complete len:118 (+),score=8.23 GHVR01118935.1:1052-1405(+)
MNPDTLKTTLICSSHSTRVMEIHCRKDVIASVEKEGNTIIRKYNKNTLETIGFYNPIKPTQGKCVHVSVDLNVLIGYEDGFIRCITTNGKQILWELNAHKNGVSTIFVSEYFLLSGG